MNNKSLIDAAERVKALLDMRDTMRGVDLELIYGANGLELRQSDLRALVQAVMEAQQPAPPDYERLAKETQERADSYRGLNATIKHQLMPAQYGNLCEVCKLHGARPGCINCQLWDEK